MFEICTDHFQGVDGDVVLSDCVVPFLDVTHHALVAVVQHVEIGCGPDGTVMGVSLPLLSPPQAPQSRAVRSRQGETAGGRLALPLVEGAVLPGVPADDGGSRRMQSLRRYAPMHTATFESSDGGRGIDGSRRLT
jgi:hypothetical protein